jgi:Putative binding domain, N-terminal
MRIIRCCGFVVMAWLAGASLAEARQCTYQLTPTSFSVGSTAGLRTLSIITGTQCSWTAVSAVSWITVTSGAAGSGIGSVTISVQENPAGAARTGTLTIAGQTVTVMQQAGSCAYNVTPTSFTVGPISGTRTVSVVAGTQCGWSSTPQATWISVTSGASGSGIGAVTFDFEGNPSSTPRTGVLTIGGQSVTISQGPSGGGPAPSAPTNLHIVR